MKAFIIGPTAWGLTLGLLFSKKGEAHILVRGEGEKLELEKNKESKRLPGIDLSPLRFTTEPEEIEKADILVIAVPSHRIGENLEKIKPYAKGKPILSGVKGLDEDGRRMSEIIKEKIPDSQVAVISGPNLSLEIARGLPAATVVASEDEELSKDIQKALSSERFRVYIQKDVIGVELGGALKNIIAIACGMSDGLGYGENAKASLMTRGIAEMIRLGVRMGAEPLTFSGLSGLGDLIATCSSPLSRNRRVGEELARGKKLEDILKTGITAEGIRTTKPALLLSKKHGVEMPITEEVGKVLFEELPPQKAVQNLLKRAPKPEFSLDIPPKPP